MTTKLTFDGTDFYNLDHVVQAKLTHNGVYEVTLTNGDTTIWPETILSGEEDEDNATFQPCIGDWFIATEVAGKLGLRPIVGWSKTGMVNGSHEALVLNKSFVPVLVREALVIKRLADGLFVTTDGSIMSLGDLELQCRATKVESLVDVIGAVSELPCLGR